MDTDLVLTDQKRRDQLDYLDLLIAYRWKCLERVTDADVKTVILESIGDLQAERTRLAELAS